MGEGLGAWYDWLRASVEAKRSTVSSWTGADLAGNSIMRYPPKMMAFQVMCSGRVDPGFVLDASSKGEVV